jgi:hypothetical protein
MYVFGGRTESKELGANDVDGQPLTFYKASGPSFLEVTKIGQVTPTYARGTATASPGASDAGDFDAVIGVTDGLTSGEAPLVIHVFDASPRATRFQIESQPCAVAPPPPANNLITMQDAYFFAHGSNLGVEVNINGAGHTWRLTFQPRSGHTLEAGYVYYRDPALPTDGELMLVREGSGWSGRVDSYEIRELSYTVENLGSVMLDRVTSFWATFAMECAGGLTMQGEIRYNAHVDVDISAPSYRVVERGRTAAFDVSAADPDGGSVILSAPKLPQGATFQDGGSGMGSFGWTPSISQRGIHEAIFEATDGTNLQRATTTIRVRGETSARFFVPDGEEFYTSENARIDVVLSPAAAGATVHQLDSRLWELTMKPPDGEALGVGRYENAGPWPPEDPRNPALEVVRGAFVYSSAQGRFEIKQIERNTEQGILTLWATFDLGNGMAGEIRYDANAAAVRTFLDPGDKHLLLMGPKSNWYLQVEPRGGSFEPGNLNLQSVRLQRVGPGGGTREIHAIASESAITDRDENGVPEVSVCFTVPELREFFEDVRGTKSMTLELSAMLLSGEQLVEPVTVQVTGVMGGVSIAAAPNPINPESRITYYTPSAGRVTVRVFDVAGRLVRTLADGVVPTGYHTTAWSGESDRGSGLASGVYYLRIDAPSGSESRSIVLMR